MALQGGHVAVKYALQTKYALPACVVLSSWTEPIPGSVRPLLFHWPQLESLGQET